MGSTIVWLSRKAYALSFIGVGIQQLVYGAIAGTFVPDDRMHFAGAQLLAYVWGALFVLAGVAMLAGWNASKVSLATAGVFLALDLFLQLPYYLLTGPYNLLEWSGVVQEGAWAGASLIFAGSYGSYGDTETHGLRPSGPPPGGVSGLVARLIPIGPVLFAIMFIVYGTDHFVYPALVSKLVPGWIGGAMFWTYFAGAALIGAGICIILRVRVPLVANLLGLMIILWCIMLHIPNSIRDPSANGGLEVSRAITTFGYAGICFLLAVYGTKTIFPSVWRVSSSS